MQDGKAPTSLVLSWIETLGNFERPAGESAGRLRSVGLNGCCRALPHLDAIRKTRVRISRLIRVDIGDKAHPEAIGAWQWAKMTLR